jgi:hypothetical protein
MRARRMVPVETAGMNGHRCEACGWSHHAPRVPSRKLAKREAEKAFHAHGCKNHPGISPENSVGNTASLPEYFRRLLER